jgi:Phage protein Gp138 N-terminal domain/GpV Apex motif
VRPLPESETYNGHEKFTSGSSEYNRLRFVFQQLMARAATATLVMVKAVHNAGELAPVGLIDVQPMVAQIDGAGKTTPHGIIHNIPYMRVQGGANAVIIDPVVGDIGLAVFASRDISSVKATKQPSGPGSRRRHSMADGLYIGGFLNAVPTQFIRFSGDGVEIKSTTVTITGDVHITGDVQVDKTLTATTNVIGGGKSLKTHTHGGVMAGGGVSGPPS